MEISIIASSFALLFLAEMGDKSQLIAMTLAHRYRLVPVIAGVFFAFLVLNLLANETFSSSPSSVAGASATFFLFFLRFEAGVSETISGGASISASLSCLGSPGA